MSSRQDQLHSYQYSQQRVVAALVTHDPDPSRSPFRRVGSTALVSVLIALVALGGTAAYAAIVNRGASKADQKGVIYIEKETGARFVFYEDGKLHPILNYASGLLITGSASTKTERVPRRTLAKSPRGDVLGIPGAPDALPGRADLTAEPWAVCSQSGAAPQSVLVVGEKIRGGTDLAGGALLVQDPTGQTFLVYGARKFLIPDVETVKRSFFFSRPAVQVSAAWINGIVAGPDLDALDIPRRGQKSAIAGAENGQVFQWQDGTNGPSQWAVALPDAAADISETQAKLLLNGPRTVGPKKYLDNAQFRQLKRSPATQATVDRALAGHPAAVPTLIEVAQRVCMTLNPKDGKTVVLVDPEAPAQGNAVVGSGPNRIDRVLVKPGTGALVEAAASSTAPPGSGTVSIVTDTGMRYAIAKEALESLGFAGATTQRLPAELVALLPEGPALDKKRALKPAPGA